jgi:two-component system, cell cycle sensor histidine kinase and response regulator CckA
MKIPTVLLIEDEAAIQRVMKRMLRGVVLTIVDSAEGAIQAIEAASEPFDTILSDFNIVGDKTGGDILEWVKANRPELVSRFVFCSCNPVVDQLHDRTVEKHDIRGIQSIVNPS